MYKIRIAIFLIALFVVGIVLTISGVSNLIKLNSNVPDFNYESMQDIKKGDYVQGYVLNIDGCYAYTTTTETKYGVEMNSYISEEYFLMPLVNDTDLADDMYITIVAKNKADRDLLYDICDATWEYYEGNENAVFPDMGIIAKVNELDSEYEGYLVETMLEAEYYSSASEVRSHVIPYTLTIYNPKSAYTSLGIGLVIVILFVVVGLVIYSKYKASLTQSYAPSAAPAADDFTIERKPSEGGFDESYTSPQPIPMPDIPQPVQPDEFFARTPKAAAPVAEEAQTPPPAPAVTEAVENNGFAGSMDELDTTGMFDDDDYSGFDAEDTEFDTDSDFSE